MELDGYIADKVCSSIAHKITGHFEGSQVYMLARAGAFYIQLSNGQFFEVEVTERYIPSRNAGGADPR